MKVILVIAEKYNPRSVRPIVQKLSTSTVSSTSSPHHQPNPSPSVGLSPERKRETSHLSSSPRGLSPTPQSHPMPLPSHPMAQHQSHPISQPQSHSISQPQSHPMPQPQSYPRTHSHSDAANFQMRVQSQSQSHHTHHFNGNNASSSQVCDLYTCMCSVCYTCMYNVFIISCWHFLFSHNWYIHILLLYLICVCTNLLIMHETCVHYFVCMDDAKF